MEEVVFKKSSLGGTTHTQQIWGGYKRGGCSGEPLEKRGPHRDKKSNQKSGKFAAILCTILYV